MLQGNAQHHNMAVGDPARADPMEGVEGDRKNKEATHAQEEPYMTLHDVQDVRRRSAFSQAFGDESRRGGDEEERAAAAKKTLDGLFKL